MKRILVVEDEAAIREFVVINLKRAGYETVEAGSGEEIVGAKAEDFYTRPDEAEAFCKATGIDALAIAFGTAHGFYSAQPKLDFDVVKNCAKATGLPLVMHGGSGVSEEGFKKAIENGIRTSSNYPEQLLYIYGTN